RFAGWLIGAVGPRATQALQDHLNLVLRGATPRTSRLSGNLFLLGVESTYANLKIETACEYDVPCSPPIDGMV
ncbi:MAG TPA: hypothetical protein VFV34_24695, partial [Blastocatellia bacterium]|nr:hypothetical protein [Blastocatellia bacterium]